MYCLIKNYILSSLFFLNITNIMKPIIIRLFTTKFVLIIALLFCFRSNLFAQPSNDLCSNAKLISPDTACVTGTSRYVGETLTAANNEVSITSACGIANARDIWYKFVARTKTPTITISNQGSGWGGIANVRIQLLSATGSCTGFSEVACASGATLTPTALTPLVEGNTYYIRIHKNLTTTIGTNHTFDICVTDPLTKAGRMNEIFARTILSGADVLNYPWEITYGPDNNLWITESKGYRVYRMNPNTGVKDTVLNISQGSTFLPLADRTFNCQFANGAGAQGGLAGMALHPNFLDGTPSENNTVYISYIRSGSGSFFTNRLAKFTYNKITNKFESPVSICDTLPGSNDHNSQRMIIAPMVAGGPKFLFYASGDMGAGQGNATNVPRTIKSQFPNSYEGKILRFNLAPDADVANNYNEWIPNSNPYNSILGVQSAVWNIGQRNNQGFAYDTALNILYGSSHGPYSDDEINILEGFKNYGHPLVVGYVGDGNYDGDTSVATTRYSAGAPYNTVGSGYSSCAPIKSEASRKTQIDASGNGLYKDPIFSAYPGASGTGTGSVKNIWSTTTGANASWPSEGWSGLDLYTDKMIPGWKKSLIAAGLKWGRIIKLQLNATGDTTLPSRLRIGNFSDTVTYFQSVNRCRDLAFGPNGKDIYLVLDNGSATSGPGTNNPVTPACPGCVQKYSFLGYADAAGLSTIPKSIDVTTGVTNTCNAGTAVTIDGTNNFLWVPITGPDGNIMAEINAMGQNLGVVTSSFYKNSSAIRVKSGIPYLDRNITITPAVNGPYGTNVKVRLYISKAEYDVLAAAPSNGLSNDVRNLRIIKNNDACSGSWSSNTVSTLVPANTVITDIQHGAGGYVLQSEVSSFSTFYFAKSNIVLPLDLLSFNGTLQSNLSRFLTWKTDNEINTANFELERSTDGNNFKQIAILKAAGNSNSILNYTYTDNDAIEEEVTILYYRLKIININGSFIYSNIVSITLPSTKATITVAPNPVFNDVRGTISSPIAGNVALRIFDNTGRIILQTTMFVRKGNNNFVQNITQLAKGAYYLDISGNGIISRTKFQKL
jgi:trimeric autotransporter adhesin